MNYDVIFLEVLQWNTPEISIVPPLLILAVHKPVMSNYQTEKKPQKPPHNFKQSQQTSSIYWLVILYMKFLSPGHKITACRSCQDAL